MSRKSIFTITLTIAAIAVPAAQAANPLGHPGGPTSVGVVPAKTSYLGHPGGPTSVGIVREQTGSASTSFRGVAGGPGGVGLVQAATPSSSTSFAWDDAAIGAGFTLGVILIAAGGFLATRRRATLAHSNS